MFSKSFAIAVRAVVIASIFSTTTLTFAAIYPGYQFLTISGNNVPVNLASSQFSGTNGVIKVSHAFSPGGAGAADNQNFLGGFHPGNFTTMFPGTGNVDGHLAQTVYANTSLVEFDLTGYSLTQNTVFGMWNTTDEVTAPVPGNPVYRLQLVDNTSTQVDPIGLFHMGNQDNQTQVQGRHSLVVNLANGNVTPGGTINGGVGTHTDAAFWRNFPAGTQKIRVYADLPPLNNIGDGVGYYFAELIPEPGTFTLLALALAPLTIVRRIRE